MEQPRQVVLNFHGVGPPGRPLGPTEDRVWLPTATFERVLDAVVGRNDVLLTFDDGNSSDVEIVLPRLRARGLGATFFPLAGQLGQPGFLDPAGVTALVDANMPIGCHGMRHRPWRGLAAAELREELVVARERLEEIVGSRVTEASCPFGVYDRRVLRSLRQAGYGRVFTSDGGWASRDSWVVPRNTVGPDLVNGALESLLSRQEPRRRALIRSVKRVVKRWR